MSGIRIEIDGGKRAIILRDDAPSSRLRWGEDKGLPTNTEHALACEVRDLRELLTACGQQFRFYEKNHRAKNTDDARAKAIVNAEFAARCEALVAR